MCVAYRILGKVRKTIIATEMFSQSFECEIYSIIIHFLRVKKNKNREFILDETIRNMIFLDRVLRETNNYSNHVGPIATLLANSPPLSKELAKLKERSGAELR
jgi:hypothetical protein